MSISNRDFFAGTADVSWMKDATIEYASAKSGVNPPPETPTPQQLAAFWIRVELRWRWKYAERMVKGNDNGS